MHIPETGFEVIYTLLLEKPIYTKLQILILNMKRWIEQGNSLHPAQSSRSPDTIKVREKWKTTNGKFQGEFD